MRHRAPELDSRYVFPCQRARREQPPLLGEYAHLPRSTSTTASLNSRGVPRDECDESSLYSIRTLPAPSSIYEDFSKHVYFQYMTQINRRSFIYLLNVSSQQYLETFGCEKT